MVATVQPDDLTFAQGEGRGYDEHPIQNGSFSLLSADSLVADSLVGIVNMDVNSSKSLQLLARLAELHQQCDPDEPWRIEEEPHDYPDGTTCFTHVVTTGHSFDGTPVTVAIGKYLTPELAELLVLMRNNLPDLVMWAQALANADG